METNKTNIAGVVLAVCAGLVASVALLVGLQRVSTLNVNVNADKPVNVSVKGGEQSSPNEQVGANAGEITYWTSGDFSDDLNVQDTLTVAGNTTFTGGLSISGNVTSTSVVKDSVSSFTSSASSQTLCSLRNTTGADRVLDDVTLVYATSSVTGGTYRFTISTAAAAATTGTTLGTDLLNDIAYAAPTNGINNLTATSTLMGTTGAKIIWRSGYYLNYMIASPTSTLTGSCRATSF
jgi:hypothetical protein